MRDASPRGGGGLLPGDTLLGRRFVIQRVLGAGGTGVVYEAFDRVRDEAVALKMLNRADANGIAYLKREFRSLSGIVHPNLVNLYELFSGDSAWFFTMALVPGVRLDAHFRIPTTGDRAQAVTDIDRTQPVPVPGSKASSLDGVGESGSDMQ